MGCGKLLVSLLLTVFLSQFSSALTAEELAAIKEHKLSALSSSLSSYYDKKDEAKSKMSAMMRENAMALISALDSSQYTQLSQQTEEGMSQKDLASIIQSGGGKALTDCLATITDVATQVAKIQSVSGQLAGIVLGDLTTVNQCLQNGVTTNTMTCITNVLSGIPKNLSELGTQTMQSIANLKTDITKLKTCVAPTASTPSPVSGTGTQTT